MILGLRGTLAGTGTYHVFRISRQRCKRQDTGKLEQERETVGEGRVGQQQMRRRGARLNSGAAGLFAFSLVSKHGDMQIWSEGRAQKVELVYKRQVWLAHQEHQQVLVRHLFLVDRLLDGLVLEVDASTTAACWIGARRVALRNPLVAFVVTKRTEEDDELLGTQRGDPTHQATWEAFMVLLAIRHLVTAEIRGRIVLFGDSLCVGFGMVSFCARARKINETAKEVAMHLAPLGHELEGCTTGVT